MSMNYLPYWVWGQIGLDLILLGAVLLLFWKLREWTRERIEPVVGQEVSPEASVRVAGLVAVLEEKRAALEKLLSQLDRKILEVQKRVAAWDAAPLPSRPSPLYEAPPGGSLRSQVESLYREGLSPEEIARRLEVNLAEVNLALSLTRAMHR